MDDKKIKKEITEEEEGKKNPQSQNGMTGSKDIPIAFVPPNSQLWSLDGNHVGRYSRRPIFLQGRFGLTAFVENKPHDLTRSGH